MNHDHLARHTRENPQPVDAKCPSEARWPICCPCVNTNITSRLHPIRGANLVLCPPQLVQTWVAEWNSSVDPKYRNKLAMRLYCRHSSYSDAWDDRSRERMALTDDYEPQANQERLVVLTAPQSYFRRVHGQLEYVVETEEEVPNNSRSKTAPKTKTVTHKKAVPDFAFGHVYRDEFHGDKSDHSTTPVLVGELRKWWSHYANTQSWKRKDQAGLPAVWLMSGTPYERGPSDLQWYLKRMELEHWKNVAEFKPCTFDAMKLLGALFNKIVREEPEKQNPDEVRDCTQRFKLMLTKLMIRRKSETDWFGKPLVKLPPTSYQQCEVPFPAEHKAAYGAIEKKAKTKAIDAWERRYQIWRRNQIGPAPILKEATYFSYAYQLRVCASFPALVELADEFRLDLTGKEILFRGWYQNPKESIYYKHLDRLTLGAPKIHKIEEIWRSWPAEERCDPEGNRIMRDPKGLIASIGPVGAFITYLVG